jgi:ribosomal-protein-alanine N-acetyltransferase
MRLADVAQVGALERECFANPWSEGILTDGLGNHLDCFWVLEEAGALLGYLSMRVITDEGELNRIAISPAYRGRGLSKLLMDTMFEYCRGHEVRRIFLEVRSGNEAARGLYASCGFSQIAVRKGYYRKPVEDALILRWEEEPPTQDGA